MFGLGKRDERAVEAVREEMNAADTRARTVLANAMAQIESRLATDHEQTARLQASTQAAIENLRHEVSSRPSDIGPVLEQVAAMCALVAERLEADRLERRALTEAITLLARPVAAEGPSRVLGGTVMPSSEPALDAEQRHDDVIELEPAEPVTVATAPVASDLIDIEPAGVRSDASPPSAQPAPAPVTIDLTAEEHETDEPVRATEIWNAFEQHHAEPEPEVVEETLDLRPRQGTRLTAARRSNAGASYR